MLAYELKQYIIDNNKVQFILETIGCHKFKEYQKEYRCALPNGSDNTKVRIYKDTLKTKIYSDDVEGDIFTLVMNIENKTFPESNKRVCEILGLKFKGYNKEEKKKEDPLSIFKNVKSSNKVSVIDLEIYDEEILLDFYPYLHISWVKEGIMPRAREKFNIGYSFKHQRIIIPHRYWCGGENDYLGIFGRTTIEQYKMLDIPKYYGIKPYSKSMNMYGLQENYEEIQRNGIVIVAESEKSVLKRYSKLDGTCVAVMKNSISPEQVKILIGLDVEIIIAFDKGISEEHIKGECLKLSRVRKVSYIYDTLGLLKNKEAPADKCNKIYNYLLKNRISFN